MEHQWPGQGAARRRRGKSRRLGFHQILAETGASRFRLDDSF